MTKTRWYLAALAAMVLCLVGWAGSGHKSEAAQRAAWEYKTVRVMHAELFGAPTFKTDGDQGWELVTAVYVERDRTAYYTFKRPK